MSEKQSGLGAYFEELKRRKGMAEMDWMKDDSDLDNLRDHPRLTKI